MPVDSTAYKGAVSLSLALAIFTVVQGVVVFLDQGTQPS